MAKVDQVPFRTSLSALLYRPFQRKYPGSTLGGILGVPPPSQHIASHHIASHHIGLHRITTNYIALHRTGSHLTTLHHIASYRITSHNIASHRIASPHSTSYRVISHQTISQHLVSSMVHFGFSRVRPRVMLNSPITFCSSPTKKFESTLFKHPLHSLKHKGPVAWAQPLKINKCSFGNSLGG